ncbi:MAG: hypothetical protein JO069_06275 [Verrucomicrobia bacterium]|nr:hypothetical protein [Verrucomicrobiota bacterium]
MTTAEARERLKASGFTEEQAVGLTDYVDRRLAEQRGKLKSWFVVIALTQTFILLGGIAFMLLLATLVNHTWK